MRVENEKVLEQFFNAAKSGSAVSCIYMMQKHANVNSMLLKQNRTGKDQVGTGTRN